MSELALFEVAREALAEAVRIDEVKSIRDRAQQARLYARQAKDRTLLANASTLQLRAERRLGELLTSAKAAGELSRGGRPAHETMETGSEEEPVSAVVTLAEAGIDKKLSASAQRWARLGEAEFETALEDVRQRIVSGGAVAVNPRPRELVNGNRTLMHHRVEPDDSLDYFPTPPWATRALIEHVLKPIGYGIAGNLVWEPACGEGHISAVLMEAGARVIASDIHDYSVEGRAPAGWHAVADFLAPPAPPPGRVQWVITNPPFGDRSLEFALRAIDVAQVGVALFVRQQWLEGVERWERLFSIHPPAIVAQFVERVPLHKGRWEPDGTTMTPYCWLVWLDGRLAPGTQFQWIPPGRREALSRPGDVERFTAHPVLAPHPSSGAARHLLPQGEKEGEGHARADQAAIDANLEEQKCIELPERSALTPADPPRSGSAAREDAGPAASEDLNAVIRAGYARNAPLAEIALATGLSRAAVKHRAGRMGLGDRARQLAAVKRRGRQ